VVRCMFTALSGKTVMDDVQISDPLDLNATVAAPAKHLTDATCLGTVGDSRD
jgi:hypothetical protein